MRTTGIAREIQSSSDCIGLLDEDGGAVRQNFGSALSHRGSREAHIDHGVCTELIRLCDHAAGGLRAALLEELRVALELSADDVLEAGGEVSPEVLGPDRAPLYQAEVLNDLPARHAVDVGENQMHPSLCGG